MCLSLMATHFPIRMPNDHNKIPCGVANVTECPVIDIQNGSPNGLGQREFVRDSLWFKPKVGDKSKGWLPHQLMCPFCEEEETVAHSLYGCKFLKLSIDTILGCYGDWGSLSGAPTNIRPSDTNFFEKYL